MRIALTRSVDSSAVAITTALVGRSRRLDSAAALLARHLAKLHVLLLGALVLGGTGPDAWRRREAAARIAVTLPVTILLVSVVGRLVQRERPFAGRAETVSLVEHAPDRSFPSRHSACAAAMTTVAWPASPVVGLLMGLGALGLAVTRIYAGLHYPSDVLGGWLIGIVVGMIARRKELPRVSWT